MVLQGGRGAAGAGAAGVARRSLAGERCRGQEGEAAEGRPRLQSFPGSGGVAMPRAGWEEGLQCVAGWGRGVRECVRRAGGSPGRGLHRRPPARGRGSPPRPPRARAPERGCAGARAREPGGGFPSEKGFAAQPVTPRPM